MSFSKALEKQKIRSKYLAYRDYLTYPERVEKSKKIHEYLKENVEFQNAGILLVYMDYRSEVITTPLVEEMLASGDKRIFAPRVDGMDIRFYEIKSLDDLRSGYQNIREPLADEAKCLSMEEISAEKIFLLVPGSVFDKNMCRMGYGKGFYDRFLQKANHENVTKAGLCFECQLTKEIPVEEHDIRMDYIFTEKQILHKE